jgi:membrane-bound ClpP family serine protease
MNMFLSISFLILALLTLYLEVQLPGMIFGVICFICSVLSLFFGFYFHKAWGVFLLQFMCITLLVVFRLSLKFLKNKSLSECSKKTDDVEKREVLIGREAIVVKDLKPSGVIEIDGEVFQARSFGNYVKKGEKVQVVSSQSFYLFVR